MRSTSISVWVAPLVAACVAAVALGTVAEPAAAVSCKAPGGTRAPTKNLRAHDGLRCGPARRVATAWDRQCEAMFSAGDLCSVRAAKKRFSCRVTRSDRPPHNHDIFLRCARPETRAGRPTATFTQKRAWDKCRNPQATRRDVVRVESYYRSSCAQAVAVTKRWDAECEPGEDRSTCTVEALGERWVCTQHGEPDEDALYAYPCVGARTGGGRPTIEFQVRVIPLRTAGS